MVLFKTKGRRINIGCHGDYERFDDFIKSGRYDPCQEYTICFQNWQEHCIGDEGLTLNHPDSKLHFVGEDFCDPVINEECPCSNESSDELFAPKHTMYLGFTWPHRGRPFSEQRQTNEHHGFSLIGNGEFELSVVTDDCGNPCGIQICSKVDEHPNFNPLNTYISRLGGKEGACLNGRFHNTCDNSFTDFIVTSAKDNCVFTDCFPFDELDVTRDECGKCCHSFRKGDSFHLLPTVKLRLSDDNEVPRFTLDEFSLIGVQVDGKAEFELNLNHGTFSHTTHRGVRWKSISGDIHFPRQDTFVNSTFHIVGGHLRTWSSSYLGDCSGVTSEGSGDSTHYNLFSALATTPVISQNGARLSLFQSQLCGLEQDEPEDPSAGLRVTHKGIIIVKQVDVSGFNMGVYATFGGAISVEESIHDNILGGDELILHDNEINMRLFTDSRNYLNNVTMFDAGNVDLIVDGIEYILLSDYTSGTVGPDNSVLHLA